jgi:hypothetical protein
MDAPQGRYRVIEKEGRLVVIDNRTGAPISSGIGSPPSPRPGGGPPLSPGPVSPAAPGPLDRAADALVAIAAKRWEADGRAVIAWEWRENGRVKRWDAALDRVQQRRLGRALLGLLAAPMLILLATIAGFQAFGLLAILAVGSLAYGLFALRRLHRESDDPARRGLPPAS